MTHTIWEFACIGAGIVCLQYEHYLRPSGGNSDFYDIHVPFDLPDAGSFDDLSSVLVMLGVIILGVITVYDERLIFKKRRKRKYS